MNPDLQAQNQQLKDMLDLAVTQRTNAQNEVLQIGAELIALKRKLAEYEKKDADAAEAAPVAPKANGHAENHAAA